VMARVYAGPYMQQYTSLKLIVRGQNKNNILIEADNVTTFPTSHHEDLHRKDELLADPAQPEGFGLTLGWQKLINCDTIGQHGEKAIRRKVRKSIKLESTSFDSESPSTEQEGTACGRAHHTKHHTNDAQARARICSQDE
jgi:hypothetical protein